MNFDVFDLGESFFNWLGAFLELEKRYGFLSGYLINILYHINDRWE